MTNAEAIITLNSLKQYYNDKNEDSYVGFDNDDNEALDLAIQVLEQQPCKDCRICKRWNECPCGKEGHEKGTSIGYSIGECKDYEPCEDCISRADILDAIETWDKFGVNAEQKLIRWQDHYVPYVHLDDVRNAIANMSSVTPTRPKGKWNRPSVVAMPYSFAYECPICRQWGNIQTFKPNYCPNCGAEMEVEE